MHVTRPRHNSRLTSCVRPFASTGIFPTPIYLPYSAFLFERCAGPRDSTDIVLGPAEQNSTLAATRDSRRGPYKCHHHACFPCLDHFIYHVQEYPPYIPDHSSHTRIPTLERLNPYTSLSLLQYVRISIIALTAG